MNVPDNLLLAFFRETTTRLLEIDPEIATRSTENSDRDSNGPSHFTLADCRRCVLDQQILVLKEVTQQFQEQQRQENSDSGSSGVVPEYSTSTSTSTSNISPTQVQERLGTLKDEPNLSSELKVAMEDMNDAARVSVCKLVLYIEEVLNNNNNNTSRNLQDEGRLERTQLMEYFGLCQSSLKVPCVANFINMTSNTLTFRNEQDDQEEEPSSETPSSAGSMLFPQSRFEYVQRLLAKGMGWDPVFVTLELRTILVDKPETVDYEYYDSAFMAVFQQLVEQTTIAMKNATLQVRSKQDAELLNDLGKGGNTRVVSVQYSEFEVDQFGTKIDSKTNAPQKSIDERQTPPSEEEQKRQLRLASEAAILQQTILGELFATNEDERNHTLKEAAETSRKVMEDAMALPTIPERIEFLRSVDARTSKQLAIHKLWSGMLQANGGKPPNMVPRK